MKSPGKKTTQALAIVATPVALVALGASVYQASYAAFTGQTRNSGNEWATGSVKLTDDDNGAARFRVANMLPGDTQTKCITVTADASVPSTVKGYAINPVRRPPASRTASRSPSSPATAGRSPTAPASPPWARRTSATSPCRASPR